MIYNFYRSLLVVVLSCLLVMIFPSPPVVAKTAWVFDGQRLIRAQIADDDRSREKGLMYKVWLPPNTGMLFVFDPPAPIAFWMKNTLLPLDMRFYDRFGRFLTHYPFAMPCTRAPCRLYPTTGNAAYVLETKATFRATPWRAPPLQLLLQE